MDDLAYGGLGDSYLLAKTQEGMVRKATMKERLDMAVKEAEARLAEAKRAREIFDRNPDLEELLNIMQRGRF